MDDFFNNESYPTRFPPSSTMTPHPLPRFIVAILSHPFSSLASTLTLGTGLRNLLDREVRQA
jgi:hypothetical protein